MEDQIAKLEEENRDLKEKLDSVIKDYEELSQKYETLHDEVDEFNHSISKIL